MGHSMGSAGTTAIVKCFPEHYASATIFNNGFDGPEPGDYVATFGESSLNFPTNLKNQAGKTIHLLHLFNLLDNCSASRDLPLIRHWHGKTTTSARWDGMLMLSKITERPTLSASAFKICGVNEHTLWMMPLCSTTIGSKAIWQTSRLHWRMWPSPKAATVATSPSPPFQPPARPAK
ncbi:MAG: hypothetical protein IPJ00_16795 [Saprospirales bacterium]|nr:hypothetical protein [Saprospirales bacterium]